MGKIKLLFVADDPQLLHHFEINLSNNYDISHVTNSEEAFSNIEQKKDFYDVTVIDMKLENDPLAGLKLIEKIHDKITIHPENVVLTTLGETENTAKCMENGAFGYVEKDRPETYKILEHMIKKAAKHRRLLRDRQTKAVLSNMSETLIKAAEGQDPFRYRHSNRITKWAVLVGKRMGLTRQQLTDLEIGARLRNIGLALIPEIIITKPGKRTETERKMLEQHPKLGYDIVKDIPSISNDILNIILHHHEMYDGRGFPDGLAGDQILIQAMITRTAIEFEHAFSPPENRAIRDPERGKSKIIALSKTGALNPEIVKYFIQVYEDGEITKVDPLSHSDELFAMAKEEAKAHNFIEVRRYCDNALAEINRENEFFGAFFCVAIGDLFFEYKQYKDASDYYKKAFKLRAGYAEAYYKRGLALERMEMWERADWHYSIATSIIPTYIEAHLARGKVLYLGGFMDEAMKSFDRVIRFDPGSASAYLGKGRIFHEKWHSCNEKGYYNQANENKINARGNYEKARSLVTIKAVKDEKDKSLEDEIIQALEALEEID